MRQPLCAVSQTMKKRSRMDWAKSTFDVRFDVQGMPFSLTSTQLASQVKSELVITQIACGTRLQLYLLPLVKVKIDEVRCDLDQKVHSDDVLFFNGYQSWTDSREWLPQDKMPHLSRFAKPIVRKYEFDRYGDTVVRTFSHRRGHFHGFTLATVRSHDQVTLFGSLDEKTGFTILEYFHNKGKWSFAKDISGIYLQAKTCVLDMVCLEGTSDEVYDAYFKLLGISQPRMSHATGWTSWYNYYQNISQSIIEKNLENFDKSRVDFFQIDDGYQTAVGDWLSIDPTKFPQGMKPIADKIHEKGMMAGIWLAPFVAETKSELYKNHADWFLKDEKGEFCCGGSNWGGFYALNLDLPVVKGYLRKVFDVVLNDWGYDMVKLDFLYAACMIPSNNKSRGQLMSEAMLFVRECVKEKYILGCGVPLASCFGVVDFCRIGCDVGLDWNDKIYMRFFHRERISTYHAIGSTIGRRHLDGRAFTNDPDVFLLRDTNISLSLSQKKTLAMTNRLFGSLLFTSDDLSQYTMSQKELYRWVMDSQKPIVTSLESKQGVLSIDTLSNGKYLMNLSSKNKKINGKNKVLGPFESIREEE